MSLKARLNKLELKLGGPAPGGRCSCVDCIKVYGWDDGAGEPETPPPDGPIFCAKCGGEKQVILIEYFDGDAWRNARQGGD